MQKAKTTRLTILAISLGATMISMQRPAQASGFAIPELNPTGMGLANAVVANPYSLGATAYNAAAMAFHDGSGVSAGLLLVKPDLRVTPTGGSGRVDSESNDLITIPAIDAFSTVSENWTAGISINAPFGLETEWPAGTFPNYTTTTDAAAPTRSKLEILDFNPSMAYKVSDDFALSMGLDLYWMRQVVFNSSIQNSPTTHFNLEGDGRGVGVAVSALYRRDAWSFGGSYHSKGKIDINGKLYENTGRVPSFFTNNATARLEVPSRLQIGIRNQATKKLAVEFDVTRTGWSSFDKLEIKNKQYDQTLATSQNNWDDTYAYRLGVTYDFTKQTQLRVGYAFDETGQGDDYFSPRIPDADRQLFSLGIGHELGNDWSIDAGYMYVKFDNRTINSTAAVVAGSENGTMAVNGTYKSSVQLFGIGVTKRFM
jgi:long-chain fatty acid transport protein